MSTKFSLFKSLISTFIVPWLFLLSTKIIGAVSSDQSFLEKNFLGKMQTLDSKECFFFEQSIQDYLSKIVMPVGSVSKEIMLMNLVFSRDRPEVPIDGECFHRDFFDYGVIEPILMKIGAQVARNVPASVSKSTIKVALFLKVDRITNRCGIIEGSSWHQDGEILAKKSSCSIDYVSITRIHLEQPWVGLGLELAFSKDKIEEQRRNSDALTSRAASPFEMLQGVQFVLEPSCVISLDSPGESVVFDNQSYSHRLESFVRVEGDGWRIQVIARIVCE